MSGKSGAKRPIIIRREEVVEGGHHGGAWKVAYADFVTAMMAFFLLMWLLNATTEEQRRGLADYFSPLNPLARGASGSGLPFGGKTPFETGEMVSDRGTMAVVPGRSNEQPPDEPNLETSMPRLPGALAEDDLSDTGSKRFDPTGRAEARADRRRDPQAVRKEGAAASSPTLRISPDARMLALVGSKTPAATALAARAAADEAALRAEQGQREQAAFDSAAQQIRDAVRGDRLLDDLSAQLSIDQTPEGLRIQLLDEDRKPMFPLGSAAISDRARELLLKVAPALIKLSEPISIAGHTDAAPFRSGDRTNWDLSSERANATRRMLEEAGLQDGRIRSVTGNADRDLLLPADPLAAANRRIAIVVLRAHPGPASAPVTAPAPATR